MIAIYLLIVLAWTWVCLCAGRIWEQQRALREDYNQRDAWANRYQDEQGAA